MKPRILFVGPARDFSDSPYDGLALRHRRLTSALADSASVSVISIGSSESEGACVTGFDLNAEVVKVPAPRRAPSGRIRRIVSVVRARPEAPPEDWSRRLIAAVAAARPEAVVTFGPWLDAEYSALFARWPCVHVFEEELARMPEIAPQSRQAKCLRAAEFAVRRRRLEMPSVVVVISEAELPHAVRRFGRNPQRVVIPQTLPSDTWPPADSRNLGRDVLAIGNLSEPRNAELLADVVELLRARADRPPELRLVMVSGAGFHPSVRAAVEGLAWVDLIHGVEDPRAAYGTARLALVAAGRATGFKATILQGWLCGVPIVASLQSALTVEARNRDAVAVGGSPIELVDLVLALWDDNAKLDWLARRGIEAARGDHDDRRVIEGWKQLVLNVARAGPAT